MANVKVSELPAAAAAVDAMEIPSNNSGTSEKVTVAQLGTRIRAQDAEISALAGLTSAADRVPYFTGSGTAALATFTSAGRALVDDADSAAQLTTLGTLSTNEIMARVAFGF